MSKGWCPSLAAPMPAADGLLVRVRPRFGWIDAAAARLLADAAEAFGNGRIDLTNRGNVQLRGLRDATVAGCAAMIGGLDQPIGRPAVMTAPLLGLDPAEAAGTLALAVRIADAVAGLPPVSGVAEKLCIGIDGGGQYGPIGADLIVGAVPDGWLVGDVGCDATAVPQAVMQWWRRGAVRWRGGTAEPAAPIGFMPYAQAMGGFGIGLVFGAMDAAVLRHLAALAVRFGDGGLRLTGTRAVVLTGVALRDVTRLRAAAARYVVTRDDPRRLIDACVGQGFCAAATTDTRADARALASLGVRLHVSGCPKGCARPAAAAFTLVGTTGGYDVVRDGRAGDAPVRRGMSVAAVADYVRASVPV